jgi:SagB-type dehydrogenase family enzyme
MKNGEIEAAWNYHNTTKHSYESIRANRHYLDWENQPKPFKIYSKLEPIPLPEHLSSSGMPALAAVSGSGADIVAPETLTIQILAEVLFLSAGITRRRRYPGGEILFRAAACTGALYHIDLYVVCGNLEGLDAGVYHFSPQDFSLRRLRAGDHRSVLAEAAGGEPAIANARCTIVSASTFWRNAWKYQSRAYRHCYWDNGTILANLLAAAAARKSPATLVLGFVDRLVNELLGLDNSREAPLSFVALGHESHGRIGLSSPLELVAFETEPLSKKEIDYPEMRAMHEASSLESVEEVKGWREAAARAEDEERAESSTKDTGSTENRLFPLQSLGDDEIPGDTIEDVILRRGSTREFARESITSAQLSTMLDRATRGIDADFIASRHAGLNDVYLIVHSVEGLPAGAYVYRRGERALELLKAGDFRRDAGYLGLGQEIPADCSVNIYFLSQLNRALKRSGNRGYRAAQLEAAVMGGKIYLAAYAQRLGASGLTFFDDEVTEFFSPDAAGKSVMFLIAVGKSAKRKAASA